MDSQLGGDSADLKVMERDGRGFRLEVAGQGFEKVGCDLGRNGRSEIA